MMGGIYMQKDSLLKKIEVCVELCKEEQQAGYLGEATKAQVEEVILPEMDELKKRIESNQLPTERHLVSFWSAFKCWDWDMRNASRLYISLLELDKAYRDYEEA